MVELRKYGETTTINFTIKEVDNVDFRVDAAHGAGDSAIMKDEGAEANTTNGFADEGTGYSIVLTATEMEAARIMLYLVDQSGTKVWLDKALVIETYGHASAQHPYMGEGVWDRALTGATHNVPASSGRRLRAIGDVVSGAVDDAAATVTSFVTDLAGGHDDHYADQTLLFTSGSLAGMSRTILAYNSSTKLVTIEEDLPEAPGNGDDFDINPVHIHPVSQIVDEVWDEVLTSATHNVAKSAGKRLRGVEEYQGYEGGFVYIDTVNGAAGSESYVNGVLDNPVNNIADANILAAALSLEHFHVASGSSITFAASQTDQTFEGEGWTLDLGGQDISNTDIHSASVSGIGTGIARAIFRECTMDSATIPVATLMYCALDGDLILGSSGTYIFDACYSAIAGTATPSVDVGAAVGNTSVNFRHYSGGMEFKNLGQAGTDNASIEGCGQVVLNANCVGGTIAIRGLFTLTDNSSTTTVSDDARIDVTQINGEVSDVLKIDTIAEMAVGAPPKNPTHEEAVMYIFMALTHKIDVTAVFKKFYDDAGTLIWQKALSDDGVTYSETEGQSG